MAQSSNPQHGTATQRREQSRARRDKDTHYFRPELAKKFGRNAAVILGGLAYKVSKSRNVRDGRKWFYDPTEKLQTRWPYFSIGGIWGILDELADEAVVFKGQYNRKSFDRTVWYSVSKEVMDLALQEEGRVAFNVPVAVKLKSIAAGILYHNLRHHLREIVQHDPECQEPWHEVNKAQLARHLPVSLATVKREWAKLLKNGVIRQHPTDPKLYTIPNRSEWRVKDPANDSAKNSTGSSTNVSFTNGSRSDEDKNGSSADENGSDSNDNTHSETVKKTNTKHHSPSASRCGVVGGKSNTGLDAGSTDTPDVSTPGISSPAAGTETTEEGERATGIDPTLAPFEITSLEALGKRKEAFQSVLEKEKPYYFEAMVEQEAISFVEEVLSRSDFNEVCSLSAPSEILTRIWMSLRMDVVEQTIRYHTQEQVDLYYYGTLEVFTAAILFLHQSKETVLRTFPDHWEVIENVRQAIIERRENDTSGSPEWKASLFIDGVHRQNREGWLDGDGNRMEFKVSVPNGSASKAQAEFAASEDTTPGELLALLAHCVETKMMADAPTTGYDPLFYSRKGTTLSFLLKYWDKISEEQDRSVHS